VAAWMNTTSLLLAPVALVPLAQRYAPHLSTMSISNARIVATSEAVGDEIFPIGATEQDIEAFRVIKEIQQDHARRLREEAEAAAAAKAAADEEAAAAAAAVEAKSGSTALGPEKQHHQQPQQLSHPFRAPSYTSSIAKSRSTDLLASFPGAATDSPTTPDGPALPPRRLGGEGLPPATVQRLRLVDCVIDAAAVRRLAELKDLEHLVFMGCTFPTATGLDGIETLASACPKLQHLVLCSCDVRQVGPLAVLSQLLTLDLSGNPLLEDLTPLSHLKDLEELNVNGCSIHSVAPLAACSSLWKLEVAGNPLGSPAVGGGGGGGLAGRSMGSIPSLHGMAASSSRPLAASGSGASSSVSCGGLELLTRLQFLDAEHCGLVNIFALTTLSALRYLSLARNRIRHDEYARLPPEFSYSFPFLEHLDLSRTTLAFLRHFDGLQRLKVLRIDDNLLAHNALPQHLAVLPELRVLHADNCGLDDIRRLPELCPKLERLYASKNKQLTDDRMPNFVTMPHLRCIHLRSCSLTATRFFQHCCQIRELDISDNTLTRSGAAELSDTSPSLEVLLIGNCGIKDTTFLKDLVHLKRVDLRGNVLNAALPMYFMMLDSHAHMHAEQQAAAHSPPHRGGANLTNTPGSLSSRSLQRVYMPSCAAGGGDDDADRSGAAFSRSSSTLLRSPHIGPSAASPSRLIMKQAHIDPLAWV
jgi:Leucine-rich repeat (LRR) protein